MAQLKAVKKPKYVPKKRYIVEPLRHVENIEAVKDVLYEASLRNYCIFVIGINTNLRASDILNLRYRQVLHALEDGQQLKIYEKKTGKPRVLYLNISIQKALRLYLERYTFGSSAAERLFTTDDNRPLSSSAISMIIKRACKKAGIRGYFASHTMRKTWAYMQRTKLNTSIPVLMVALNHQTQAQTLQYLGITSAEEAELFTKLTL
jgi:integrase